MGKRGVGAVGAGELVFLEDEGRGISSMAVVVEVEILAEVLAHEFASLHHQVHVH